MPHMDPNRKEESWKMFDQIASTYDKINRLASFGCDKIWRKKVASFFPKKEALDLLDVATGTGDQIFSLKKGNLHRVVGVDLSKEMVEIGREKAKKHPIPVEWCVASAEKLPFEADSFDVATFAFGIRNVPTPFFALEEIYRVLRPKGRVLILEFSLPAKILRPFFFFHIQRIIPWIGKWYRQEGAYHYLHQTIRTFPHGKAFCDLLRSAKFCSVRQKKMALGAVSLYIGEKG